MGVIKRVVIGIVLLLIVVGDVGTVSANSKGTGGSDGTAEGSYYIGYPEQTRRKTEVNGVLLVNKRNPLPEKYVPANLQSVDGKEGTKEAVEAMQKLMKGALNDKGYKVRVVSGYRDYAYQKGLYDNYKKDHGVQKADTFSARPGYSEHQTGLTFDVLAGKTTELTMAFGDTAEGKWIAQHAHEYGFIIRYPKGKENITKYQYEPWHLRYIGVNHAKAMKDKKVSTLEEYLNAVDKTVFDILGDEPGMVNGNRTDGKEGGVDANGSDGSGEVGSDDKKEDGEGSGSTGSKRDPFEPFRDHKVNNSIVGVDTNQNVLPGETSYTFLVTAEKTYKFMQKVMMFMCAGLILFVSLQGVSLVLTTNGDVRYTKFLDKTGKVLFGDDGYSMSTKEIGFIIVKNVILLVIMMLVVMCSYYVAIQGKIYAGLSYILSFIM